MEPSGRTHLLQQPRCPAQRLSDLPEPEPLNQIEGFHSCSGINIIVATEDRTVAVSAQIAIYPLRQEHLSPSIEAVRRALRAQGLEPVPGPMSTYVVGEEQAVFTALQEGFAQASGMGHVVLTVTLSNACPLPR